MIPNLLKFLNKYKEVFYIIFSYLIFYAPYLFTKSAINGNDMQGIHYPAAYYLRENLLNLKFPFWTEKLYSGFPLYGDGEMAYLNPLRIFLVLVFGFVQSFKIEHFIIYFIGSFFLFKFLKKLNFDFLSMGVTHCIYYYSYFHVVKMLHPNIIYITMLFPANIYFIYQFFCDDKNFQLKYLIYSVLVNALGFYYGSINAVLYSFLAQGIFSIIYGVTEKKHFIRIVKYWGVFLVLFVILILPQLYPSSILSNSGARGEEKSFDFTEGSWTPSLTLTTIFPFILGRPDQYIGKIMSEWWLIHEVYYYIGITSFVVGVVGFFSVKDKRIKVLFSSSLWIFVLLAFIKYSPIQNLFNFLPFNIFRYWGRMWFFVMFNIALSAGYLFNSNLKFNKKDLWYLLPPIVWSLFLEIKSGGIFLSKVLLTHLFVNKGLLKDPLSWFSLLLAISTIALIYLYKKQNKNNYKYYLVGLVFIDLFVFGNLLLKSELMPVNSLINTKLKLVLQNQIGKRTVVYQEDYISNRPLYYNAWNVFGYAGPYEDVNYAKYLKQSGFESSRRVMSSVVTPSAIIGFGIKDIVTKDLKIIKVDNMDRLFDSEVTYNTIGEGFIDVNMRINNPQTINTKIRNYDGWVLYVDGKKVKFSSTPEDLFLKFDLAQGNHNITLKYIPKHLMYGIGISLIGLIAFVSLLRFRKLTSSFFR